MLVYKVLFCLLISLEFITRNGIGGSYRKCMYNFVRSSQTVLQDICCFVFPLMIYERSRCFTSLSALIFCWFFKKLYYIIIKCYLIVTLIYISLMTNNVQQIHLFFSLFIFFTKMFIFFAKF